MFFIIGRRHDEGGSQARLRLLAPVAHRNDVFRICSIYRGRQTLFPLHRNAPFNLFGLKGRYPISSLHIVIIKMFTDDFDDKIFVCAEKKFMKCLKTLSHCLKTLPQCLKTLSHCLKTLLHCLKTLLHCLKTLLHCLKTFENFLLCRMGIASLKLFSH